MDEEQRWAKTGLMISAGAHGLLGGVALFYGALFNAPDDEPIAIMQTAIVSEEEFAEIVGVETPPEEPPEVLASVTPPPPAEAAELSEPAEQPPESSEPPLSKAPFETSPPPPPPLTFKASRDVSPSEEVRKALERPDPKVFEKPEQPKPPEQDQVAETDFSDRIEEDACVAVTEMRALCSEDQSRCAPGASLTAQIERAEQACKAAEEQLAEAKRQEEERLKQEELLKEEQRKKEEEAARLAEEKLQEEKRREEEAKQAEQKKAMRQALRSALADLKRRAERKAQRVAAARKKQLAKGDSLLDFSSELPPGEQPEPRQAQQGSGRPLPLSSYDKLGFATRVSQCWLKMPPAPDLAELLVEYEVRLDRDGNVIGDPKLVFPSGGPTNPRQARAAFNARQAILSCAPHKGPIEKYNQWRTLTFVFDQLKDGTTVN